MLLSATRASPSLIARARASPTPSTLTRSAMLARMIFGSRPKRSITWSAIDVRQARDAREEAVAARLHRRVEVEIGGEPEQRRDDAQVEEILVGDVGELVDHDVEAARLGLDEVVAAHEPALVLDAAGELLELQRDEAAVVAELDDVALDLVGDAAHHLGPLEHGGHVAERHEVFHLERRQGAGDPVEAGLVAAEDLERLVGAARTRGIATSVRLKPR